jgi:hypothetical protein
VVQLNIAEARVLVACGLPIDFFDLWCRIVAEVVGGFHRLEVRDIGGVGLAYVAEVVAVGGGYFGGVVARTEALASVPAGKGSRRCTGAT